MIIKIEGKWADSPASHIHINDVDGAVSAGQHWRDDLHILPAYEKIAELARAGSLTEKQADAVRAHLEKRMDCSASGCDRLSRSYNDGARDANADLCGVHYDAEVRLGRHEET